MRLGIGSLQSATITLNGRRSGVSGSPAALGALIIDTGGTKGNVLAGNGGFIGHTDFDLSTGGNPQGMGSVPIHTFGVSANLVGPTEPAITIGSGEAAGPWRGLGGDRGTFLFGSSPTSLAAVQIRGFAEMSSLGGEFIVNANVLGLGNSTIERWGSGFVPVDHVGNEYAGNIFVRPGGILRINGSMRDVNTITVEPRALIGGNRSFADTSNLQAGGARGVTPSTVIVQDGGIVDPGINVFNNALGEFEVDNLQLYNGSILEFEFNGPSDFGGSRNDRLRVTGALVLDGEFIVNQLQNFDNQSTYTIIEYRGTIKDNGLVIRDACQEICGLPAREVARIQIIPFTDDPTGGRVVLTIP